MVSLIISSTSRARMEKEAGKKRRQQIGKFVFRELLAGASSASGRFRHNARRNGAGLTRSCSDVMRERAAHETGVSACSRQPLRIVPLQWRIAQERHGSGINGDFEPKPHGQRGRSRGDQEEVAATESVRIQVSRAGNG